jgi:hypothetical protein
MKSLFYVGMDVHKDRMTFIPIFTICMIDALTGAQQRANGHQGTPIFSYRGRSLACSDVALTTQACFRNSRPGRKAATPWASTLTISPVFGFLARALPFRHRTSKVPNPRSSTTCCRPSKISSFKQTYQG